MNGNDQHARNSVAYDNIDTATPTNREPLKLVFSLSSLRRGPTPEPQDAVDKMTMNHETENNGELNNSGSAHNGDSNHDQDSSEVDTEVDAYNMDGPSKGYGNGNGKQDIEMENAPNVSEIKSMGGYNHDYSNPESASDSNMNMMKEDEEMNSINGMSQEGNENDIENETASQDDFDEPGRARRTRSASIDDRDHPGEQPTDKSSSQDESGSITGANATLASGIRKKDTDSQESMEKSSRSAAAAERELLGFREPATTTAPTTSFLDSLSEEQRRDRTRHLPDVAGFRRLHKSEIKRDMAIVRKMLKASKSKKSVMDEEAMNIADRDMMDTSMNGPSEDESHSDVEIRSKAIAASRVGRGNLSEMDITNILENPELPNIFSLPFTDSPYICTDVKGNMTGAKSTPSLFSSPQVVESITAFNPPRPPESVGPKKMHRLNRWERNPQDVEVDLSNYRKTVERTRQELHKAEGERERIEVVGQHLRAHYMTQLQCMRHEMELLNESYDATQAKCIKAADLLTSKTRSRGVARGSNVMKDVLSVLKSRGDSNHTEDAGTIKVANVDSSFLSGIGGISEDGATTVASGWLLSGDEVSTPYGKGVVEELFGTSIMNSSSTSGPPVKSSTEDRQPPQSQEPKTNSNGLAVILPPRVCIQLAFGKGYFSPANVKSLDNASKLDDGNLGKRWMAMMESTKLVNTCIDAAVIDNYEGGYHAAVTPSLSSSDNRDANDEAIVGTSEGSIGADKQGGRLNKSLLPFGSSLLPSASYRGSCLESMPIDQVEKNISDMLAKSSGVLGTVRQDCFIFRMHFITSDDTSQLVFNSVIIPTCLKIIESGNRIVKN